MRFGTSGAAALAPAWRNRFATIKDCALHKFAVAWWAHLPGKGGRQTMVPITDVDLPALWMTHMQAGRFEEAWQVSDRLRALQPGGANPELPRHLQRIWDGRPLDGRVLVRCYHGLGDTIQFARYLPLLRQRAAHVILWAQAPLIPLLQTVDAGVEILPLHDGDPAVAHDVDLEIMELGHVFRSTPETLPREVPYIHVERAPLSRRSMPRVGLVWRAGDWA